jgi:uncharacterized damage-inducible protein DinB
MLIALFEHLAWADACALAALRAMPSGTAAAEQARTIYAHVAAAEHVWLARLDGRAPGHAVWPSLDLDEAAALAAASATGLRAHAALDAAGLAREVAYRNSAGQAFTNSVADILAQVALHGSYHRGQLALLVRQGGASPAVTDFIVFARDAGVPSAPPGRAPAR